MTGIVEVQLPIEYKIKNIEETEKAKREMLQNNANETRTKPVDAPYIRCM